MKARTNIHSRDDFERYGSVSSPTSPAAGTIESLITCDLSLSNWEPGSGQQLRRTHSETPTSVADVAASS